jgi:hypothetical protein
MSSEVDEAKLSVIQAELDRVSSIITEKGSTYDRVLALAAVIFSIGFGAGLQDGHEVLLVVLPLPIVLLIAFSFSVLIEQLAQGGYKRFLEERANDLVGADVLNWETTIAPRIGHASRTDQVIVPGLYFAFYAAVWIVSIAITAAMFTVWLGPVLAGFALSAVCVIVPMIESRSASEHAYRYACDRYSGDPSVTEE